MPAAGLSTIESTVAVVIEHSPTFEPTEMSIAPPTRRTVIIIASKPNNVTALTMLNRLRGRKKISPRNVPKIAIRITSATSRLI